MKALVFLRRVVGRSMTPKLEPGQLIVATGWYRHLHPGQVVIIEHEGKQKIKRIEQIDEEERVFVIGDNLQASTDSRHFGWLDEKEVIGKVLFPKLAK